MQNFRWETPDLAPSEFNLFAALKENLSGCRFNCDEDVRHAACHVAEATRNTLCASGMDKLTACCD
jgi:hypothetical protein